jgi:hypothetical protein
MKIGPNGASPTHNVAFNEDFDGKGIVVNLMQINPKASLAKLLKSTTDSFGI